MDHQFLRKIRKGGAHGAARHTGTEHRPADFHLPHGATMTRHFGEQPDDGHRKFPGGPKPPQAPIPTGWRAVHKKGHYGATGGGEY